MGPCGVRIYGGRGRDIWVHLQEPEAVLIVFHVAAQKLTSPGNHKADVLSQYKLLATDTLVVRADWVQSDHHCAQVGWHIAKEARLPLKILTWLMQ